MLGRTHNKNPAKLSRELKTRYLSMNYNRQLFKKIKKEYRVNYLLQYSIEEK